MGSLWTHRRFYRGRYGDDVGTWGSIGTYEGNYRGCHGVIGSADIWGRYGDDMGTL